MFIHDVQKNWTALMLASHSGKESTVRTLIDAKDFKADEYRTDISRQDNVRTFTINHMTTPYTSAC